MNEIISLVDSSSLRQYMKDLIRSGRSKIFEALASACSKLMWASMHPFSGESERPSEDDLAASQQHSARQCGCPISLPV